MAITIDVQDLTITANTTITAASLIVSLDGDGPLDTITQYQFTDLGDAGHFTVNGVAQAANTPVTVSAANLGNVQYVSGSDSEDMATDHILINVNDPHAGGLQSGNQLYVQISTHNTPLITGSPGNDVFNDNGISGEIDVGEGGHDIALIPLSFTGDTPADTYSEQLLPDSTFGSIRGTAVLFQASTIDNATPEYAFLGVEEVQFADGKTFFVENSDNANIARLYSAAFDRVPDATGLFFWEDVYANNISAATKAAGYYVSLAQTNDGSGTSIAGGFMQSSEFINRYGTLTDTAFVNAMYQNVLGRAPDQAGLTFWLNQLEHNGQTREVVLVGFAESPENVAKTSADWLIQTS